MKKFYAALAFGISALFSPYVTASLFILIITYLNAEDIRQFLPWMGIAFLFAIVIPGGYVLWMIEKKDLHDIHLSNHSERKIPFLLTALSAAVGAVALFAVGAAKPVIVMGVVYAVNAITVALITLFWKISIHSALLTAVTTVLVILFGLQFAWLYLLLIPLAWSRIYRHRHTLSQVLGGALMAFVSTAFVFWLFNYIR